MIVILQKSHWGHCIEFDVGSKLVTILVFNDICCQRTCRLYKLLEVITRLCPLHNQTNLGRIRYWTRVTLDFVTIKIKIDFKSSCRSRRIKCDIRVLQNRVTSSPLSWTLDLDCDNYCSSGLTPTVTSIVSLLQILRFASLRFWQRVEKIMISFVMNICQTSKNFHLCIQSE